ncbi:voltage-gated potassium channel regulatory subunit KCNG2 isoform X2 [Brachyhypopomus gauderio]|uniref:voltage-gated potassium channel regulatory subunit KCNG2 isoform X2 n=1 Tax=Brachyhypopomus gauderio TaxID=698409 RepID=UPI0040422215
MPIISNANDFSNFSVSTDDSSLDQFFTEILETETAKGVYYRRAQLLRDPSTAGSVDHGRLALINVGGDRYTFPWSTLDEFPLSRLGQLRHCRGPEEIAHLCDDYDETRREFFFDRSAAAFRVILNFLAAGKLRMLGQSCAVSLSDELVYWGIDPARMERCCRRRMLCRLEEAAERKQRAEERRRRRIRPEPASEESHGVMGRLREAVNNPHSGWLGKSFACLSVVMIAVTVVSLCISTMPDLREEESQRECSQRCQHMFIVETVCVAWFTLELALRFMQARSKLVFAREPLNVIDTLAILPYYVSLVLDLKGGSPGELAGGGSGRGYLDKLGLVLRVMRALRILYVMRLARHSLGLQTLGLTMQRSTRELGLLLLFLCVAVALFSPLVHLAENELATGTPAAHHGFSSIPASYWWAVISMTTVGYGDMVPRSIPGQVVAFSSILSGILIMAFPATSIFHVFSRSYRELKQEHGVMYAEERAGFWAAGAADEVSRGVERNPHAWPQLDINEGCRGENTGPALTNPSSHPQHAEACTAAKTEHRASW